MNDEDIEKLKRLLAELPAGSRVAWRTEMPTSHDGPGLTGSNYRPVFREVTRVVDAYDDGDGIPEPVAFLGDGIGGYVALLACEATEFFVIKSIF